MRKHNSLILIIDGIDGAGKHTLANSLREHLDFNKKSFTYFNEDIKEVELYTFPDYNGLCGNLIKNEINSGGEPEKIATLFALDRKIQGIGEDKYECIKILDRYYPSNLAFQYELGINNLIKLEKDSYIGSAVFIIDIPVEESYKRRPNRRDKYEEDREKMEEVRQRYLDLAHQFGWILLDGTKSTTELVEDIIIHVCYRMNNGLSNTFHEEE